MDVWSLKQSDSVFSAHDGEASVDGSLEFLRIPTPDRGEIMLVAVGFGLLFVSAILVEILRRAYLRKQHVQHAWKEVYRIASSKDLSEKELRLLERVVRGHCPLDPLGFVTVRRVFNAAIEAYLNTFAADSKRLDEEGILLRELRVRLGLDFVPVGQRIDSTRDIAPGQVILARRVVDSRAPWLKLTVTHVDEAVILAALDPMDAESETRLLGEGDELTCRMWREDDARYAFNCRIVRVERVDGFKKSASVLGQPVDVPDVIALRHGNHFQRTQSRSYFRVRHNQPATIGIVPGPLDGNYEGVSARRPNTYIRGRIINLSAGGLAAEVPQALPQHVLLRVTLDLPDTEPLTVTGRIVGISALGGGRHLVRASFVDISESERDRIAQYVWRRQQPTPRAEHVVI